MSTGPRTWGERLVQISSLLCAAVLVLWMAMADDLWAGTSLLAMLPLMIGTGPATPETGRNGNGSLLSRAWKRYRRRSMRARIPYEGLAYMVILIILMCGALLGKSNLLLLVFAFMAGPWIVNGSLCYMLLRGIDATRCSPRHVMAGEPFSVEITVINSKRLLSSWVLTVMDRVQHTHEQVLPRVLFTRVPARSQRTEHYQARLMHRGKYELGPIRVTTRFPLGLAERSLIIQEADEILVYPQVGELAPRWRRQSQNARELVQQSASQRGSYDDEFHRIREYRTGDDPRAIHWKTSARQNELMVREYHQSREDDLTILLDLWTPTRASVANYQRAEYAISFAATVGYMHCLDARGSQLGISVLGHEVDEWSGVAGPFAIHPFLECLALSQAGTARPLNDFVNEALSLHGSKGRCLLITTRPTQPAETPLPNGKGRRWNTGGEELRVAYEELIQLSTADRADRSQYSMEIIEANPQVLSDVFHLASEPE